MTHDSIDQNALNALLDSVGGDKEFLGELLETFFEDAPMQFELLHKAFAEKDPETFRRAAHSLKSNSASFGATLLGSLSKQLEDAGKTGEISGTGSLLDQAEQEYAKVKAALENVIHGD